MNPNTMLKAYPMVGVLATIVCLVGGTVVVGWYLHLEPVIRIHPRLVPMVFNTALCLLFSGMTLHALRYQRQELAVLLATLPLFFGLATLAQYLFNLDFGIDQLFMVNYLESVYLLPGRMASSVAFCFILFGIVVWIYCFLSGSLSYFIMILAGVLMIVISLFAMVGFFISLYTHVPWGNFASMALHTALSMIVLGIGLIQLLWTQGKAKKGYGGRLLASYLKTVSIKSKVIIISTFLMVSYVATLMFFGFFYIGVKKNDADKDRMNQTLLQIFDVSSKINKINQLVFPVLYQDDIRSTLINFSSEKSVDYSDVMQKLSATVQDTFTVLDLVERFANNDDLIKKIRYLLLQYKSKIFLIYDLRKEIGFSANVGLMGAMRNNIHNVEEYINKVAMNPTIEVSLLQMRRHEKDFIQREDQISLEKHSRELKRLQKEIAVDLYPDSNPDIFEKLELYEQLFKSFVEKQLDVREQINQFKKIHMRLNTRMHDLTDWVKVQTDRNNQEHQGRIANASGLFVMIFSMISVVTMYLSYLFFQSLIIPMTMLKESAVRIAQGEYDIAITLSGSDEIGQMAKELQEMKETMRSNQLLLEEKIKTRTGHLEITNQILSDTIDELNFMQKELIHSEKMASLGRLVAGFAHEINTPIGIGITTMSILPSLVDQLTQMLEQESLDEDELNVCLENLRKNAEL
ncbi:MAG: HAMP domain-containing protein, partial [Magnetococcales bacterium]|nr:HAMP domain-containing protein [Magnetococcales bacterium]